MSQKKAGIEKLKADLGERDAKIRDLEAEIEECREKLGNLEDNRKAMLYMLEDLNESYDSIEKSKEEWVKTFDAISDPLFIHDGEFRIIKANRAYQEAAGIPFGKLINRAYWEVFPKMDGPFERCAEAIKLQEEEEEEEYTDPSTGRIYRIRYYLLKVADNRWRCSIHVMEDVTEVKKVQEMLVQSAKLASIGELAANVAHEINNPMTAVLGYTSLILDEMEEGDEHYDELKVVESEGLRVRGIVRNLLNFARQRELKKEETDINEVLDETLSLVVHMAEISNITIVTRYGKNLPRLEMDTNQMKQVFINIINNACHAMEGGGKLSITTRMVNKNLHVTFRDTGCGMPKDVLDRVFDPFFTRKGEKGTGLGLSVSYGVVKNHGGDIMVKSEVGKGSEFTVILPA